MARLLRIAYPNAFYHLICRGNAQQNIYRSDSDRLHFLRVLGETVNRFSWVCYAYCLMSNHFHLLVQTPLANISESMKFMNGTFTQYFNWTYQRVGHLYQGRYKSFVVDEKTYFDRLCRYIVMNPVQAKICDSPGDYRWSSFNATMGRMSVPDFLSVLPVLNRWGDTMESARKKYAEFVARGIEDSPLVEAKHQLILGDDFFIEKIRPHLPAVICPDMATSQKALIRPPLNRDLLQSVEGVQLAKRQGYRMWEMAKYLGIHQVTWSRRCREMMKKLGSGPKI